MNAWVKLLILGIAIGISGLILLGIGWTSGETSLIFLSIGAAVGAGILFTVGLIGYLVSLFRTTNVERR